jgi:CAAX protease family protein
VLSLLGKIFKTPAHLRWYVFAAGYFVMIKLLAAIVYRITTGGWPLFGHEAFYIIAAGIIFSTPMQAGEEIGWRGFALPLLANHFGFAGASILLGIIWAAWHLPFFFYYGADKYGQSFPVYLLSVTALSVAMAWLYWRTDGSLLLTMLMHSAVNNTTGIVPSILPGADNPFSLNASPIAWISTAFMWIFAVYFLMKMREAKIKPTRDDVSPQQTEVTNSNT